ncbi:MAG: hypothetical protein R3F02_04650 [Thiolinea sp.]
MKFSELKNRYSMLKKKYGGKKSIKVNDLEELRALLLEKKEAYRKKLAGDLSERKREKTKRRIRVIKAQIEKIDKLLAD